MHPTISGNVAPPLHKPYKRGFLVIRFFFLMFFFFQKWLKYRPNSLGKDGIKVILIHFSLASFSCLSTVAAALKATHHPEDLQHHMDGSQSTFQFIPPSMSNSPILKENLLLCSVLCLLQLHEKLRGRAQRTYGRENDPNVTGITFTAK